MLCFDNVVQKFCSCPWYREDASRDSEMHWWYRGTLEEVTGISINTKKGNYDLKVRPTPAKVRLAKGRFAHHYIQYAL